MALTMIACAAFMVPAGPVIWDGKGQSSELLNVETAIEIVADPTQPDWKRRSAIGRIRGVGLWAADTLRAIPGDSELSPDSEGVREELQEAYGDR